LFQDLTIEELLELQRKREIRLVDVRSESEFAEFSMPGAMSIPFFNDAERAEIGTLYKQVSVQAAKERGLEIMSAKLPAFVKQFAVIPDRIAVFCWRGGMRSKTTATVLGLMGIRVYRLAGGIRSYRQWVVSQLESFPFKPRCIVIGGHTGTGKTTILQNLKAQGFPVIDLEGLAGHRGSIFGGIGLEPKPQKAFEALLLHELLQLNDSPYVLIEAESKRIGKAMVPDFLMDAKEKGVYIQVELPVAERVRNILRDYDPDSHKEACIAAFERIRKRIHTPIAAEIEDALEAGSFPVAIELLLAYYYDSRYDYAGRLYEQPPIICEAANTEDATAWIAAWLKSEFGERQEAATTADALV